MTEFTAEQEAEIQKRIQEAQLKQRELDNYRTAGLQAYRAALQHILANIDQVDPKTKQITQRGLYPQIVYIVLEQEYTNFVSTYFPPAQPPEQKPESAADEDKQD